MPGDAGRMGRDLARWRANGWVTAEGEVAIRAELSRSRWRLDPSNVFAVLAAVLIGFAAMSFVAANWQEMPRLARLGLLVGTLVAAYAGAGWLYGRGMPGFAEAAVLLGVALYGADIMLIAQMYHIEGHPPDAVLMWMLGALLAGALLQARSALVLAMLLVALWTVWETGMAHGVHWAFLPVWAIVTLAMAAQRWAPGLHLAAIVLSVWVVSLGYIWGGPRQAHEIPIAVAVLVGALAVVATRTPAVPSFVVAASSAVLNYALAVGFAGLFALQFLQIARGAALIGLAIVTLAVLVAAIGWGLRNGHRGLVWVAYTAFSLEVVGVYFKTVGTLLGTSVFFLSSGLVVAALAAFAWRLHKSEAPLAQEGAP